MCVDSIDNRDTHLEGAVAEVEVVEGRDHPMRLRTQTHRARGNGLHQLIPGHIDTLPGGRI